MITSWTYLIDLVVTGEEMYNLEVNCLPPDAGLEDFYIPHSGCTLISGKRLTV